MNSNDHFVVCITNSVRVKHKWNVDSLEAAELEQQTLHCEQL